MQNQAYANFWQRIHSSAKAKGFPLRVMFELTYRCNFNCKHCYVPLNYQKRKELKTKEIFSILDQLAELNCFYLGFTGGDPFIRKDALDIFRYAKKKGFEIIIYANGSLINKKIANELADLRPNKVDITVPAMSKNAFEVISGLSGSHAKVFAAIDLLHKKAVGLGFKTCVLKENEGEIKDIQAFAASLGALHRLDDMLSARLDGSEEPYKYRGKLKEIRATRQVPGVKEKKEFIDCNLETNQQILITDNLFKCGVGQTQAAITPQGELKMCLMLDHYRYNILNSSFKDCWNRLKKDVAKIKSDNNYKCPRCKLQIYCKWCPAKSWLYNKTFTSCEPETRKKARSIAEN